jgi:hypothetical protein
MLMTSDMKDEEIIFSKVRDEYWKTYLALLACILEYPND